MTHGIDERKRWLALIVLRIYLFSKQTDVYAIVLPDTPARLPLPRLPRERAQAVLITGG